MMFDEKQLADLSNASVLVTGGTGSFGLAFVETIFKKFPDIKRLVIFSRDEMKQNEMAQSFPLSDFPAIRFFLGDVRDKERLYRAFQGIDHVVHAAALKQIPAAEYNPMEFVKTNIIGAENIINVALDCNIKRVVALSTDKAAAPVNLYGATKLCSDKLFVAANSSSGSYETNFSVVRYGNVMGSRGSVIPLFMKSRNNGPIPITHTDMTRFNITLDESVSLVLFAMKNAWGGEIYVPKIPSFKITDLAEAIAPGAEQKIIGIRPGEKIHEVMITENDSLNTIEFDKYYVLMPPSHFWDDKEMIKEFNGKPVEIGFKYDSLTNTSWLSVEELRTAIKENVDSSFSV